jgi:hypothetical protein
MGQKKAQTGRLGKVTRHLVTEDLCMSKQARIYTDRGPVSLM